MLAESIDSKLLDLSQRNDTLHGLTYYILVTIFHDHGQAHRGHCFHAGKRGPAIFTGFEAPQCAFSEYVSVAFPLRLAGEGPKEARRVRAQVYCIITFPI